MRWLKAREAAAYAGNISPKVLYRAVRDGRLKAARIGVGRNLVFAVEWVDEWLTQSVETGSRSDDEKARRMP